MSVDGVCTVPPGPDGALRDLGPPHPDQAPPDLRSPDLTPPDLPPPDVRPSPFCGNGWIDKGEQCDDANFDNTDECLDTCRKARCGDGFLRAGKEVCDDGNLSNIDGCLATCTKNVCGDGYVNLGVEECDDKDKDNTDACIDTCKVARCGDGYVFKGVEECDDGNNKDGDACPAVCKYFSSATPGKVSGKAYRFGATDNTGNIITLSPGSYTSKCKSDGSFTISSVPPGIYTLTATYPYFSSASAKNITVLPSSTFNAPDLLLARVRMITSNISGPYGISGDDKFAFWKTAKDELMVQPLPSGTATVVAKNIKTIYRLINRTHLAILGKNNEMHVLKLGQSAMTKVATAVSGIQTTYPGGWFLAEGWPNIRYWVSPAGKGYPITKGYRSSHDVAASGRRLVLGKDGLSSLPMAGGAPASLDSLAGHSFCSAITTDSGCDNSATSWLLSKDKKYVYYIAHPLKKGSILLRRVSVASGPAVTLATFTLSPNTKKVELKLFGADTHLLVQESGSKNGWGWLRYSSVSVSSGKTVTIAEHYTPNTGGNHVKYPLYTSPDGSAVAYFYGSSYSGMHTLRLVSTDGKVDKDIGNVRAARPSPFSTDGKRIVWSSSSWDGLKYWTGLHSMATDGSDLRTHIKDVRTLFNTPGDDPEVFALAGHMVMVMGIQGMMDIRAVPYTIGAATKPLVVVQSCKGEYEFNLEVVGHNLRIFCRQAYGGTIHQFTTKGGKTTTLASGIEIVRATYGTAADTIDAFKDASGKWDWYLNNRKTGAFKKLVSKAPTKPHVGWSKRLSGEFVVTLMGVHPQRSYYCVDPATATATYLGNVAQGQIFALALYPQVNYHFFLDPAASTVKALALQTCKVVSLGSGGITSLTNNFLFSPDRKSVAYGDSAGLHYAPLTGGAGKLLSKTGKMGHLGSGALYYIDQFWPSHATAPGLYYAAVPLTGGKPQPFLIRPNYNWLSGVTGERDFVYSGSFLYYVDMP